jgi:eukaryotic-like serine/threonine-protein kinase
VTSPPTNLNPRSPPSPTSGGNAGEREALVARLADEMNVRWHKGDRLRAEHFLDRHAELWDQPSAVMDLIYEEICLRHECRETLDPEEIFRRFPRWKRQLAILLNCLEALETSEHGGLPQVGASFGDFHLLAELGRGGQGRVFVAKQSSLGDRPVVLKITPRRGDEHLSLARLQHTHIVPLLSVQDEPDGNLRVLCMPYFGGLTLAALLDGLRKFSQQQRTGRHLLTALDEARAAAPVLLPPGRDPSAPFLERASYVQAIAWIGACLAEALKYAHDRNLVHLDVKPSNVLLTANCQPMLLDFHLAREPLHPGESGAGFGGTPVYMSPEQKQTLAAIKKGNTLPEAVDGRSDIFSLGLVLYEALGGALPSDDRNLPISLQECNPSVPTGLSDIVGKCLCWKAANRYRDAGALAADLWAHLNDLPLCGVANRSVGERWRKWRRRKPYLLTLIAMLAITAAVTAAALTLGLLHLQHRVDDARAALSDGSKLQSKGHYPAAVSTFERGLAQLEQLPGHRDLRQDLLSHIQQASNSQLAQELHAIADRFRLLYGADSFPAAELETLQAPCREFWDKRELILQRLGKDVEPTVAQSVQLDLLDLVILGTDLRVRLAGENEIAAARQEALQVLAQAEALFGPNAILYRERRIHAEGLGLADLANEAQRRAVEYPPKTSWEHYALGRSLMNLGQLDPAAVHFDRAVAIQPNGLWPNFYQGICCYRLGRFEDSALAFTACTSLAPNVAGCFYNRALAFIGLGRPDRALQDLDRALALDPGFTAAARNRTILNTQKLHKQL